MKRLSPMSLVGHLTFASVVGCTGAAPALRDFAVSHVVVIDLESGRLSPDQTILIAGNRIASIESSAHVRLPGDIPIYEARGKYVIPGLWDMHVHSSSDRTSRQTYLPMHVAYGVTGVRDMKADCFDPCDGLESSIAEVQQWRADIVAGRLIGPRIIAASTLIQGPPPGELSSVYAPATEDEARALVRLLKERRVDLIKTYGGLSREAYFALADEARKQGIPFAGHVPNTVRMSEASEAGQRSIEHTTGLIECSEREDRVRPLLLTALRTRASTPGVYVLEMLEHFSEAKCAELYARFIANGTWQVPTLAVHVEHERSASGAWDDNPRLRYVTPDERAYWTDELRGHDAFWGGLDKLALLNSRKREVVVAMQRAGVSLLAGSDAGAPLVVPGLGLHDELELLVDAGLTTAQALRAATLNAAMYLEATDSLGSVQAGKVADLVLLDANPLEDIRNTRRINAVVINGRFLDRAALDQILAQVEIAATR